MEEKIKKECGGFVYRGVFFISKPSVGTCNRIDDEINDQAMRKEKLNNMYEKLHAMPEGEEREQYHQAIRVFRQVNNI